MWPVLIRERRDEDLPVCVDILRVVHEQAGYPINWPADPARWLSPESALGCWVAVVDDRVAGHVVLTAVRDHAEVERLFVDPGATGQGIGRALLQHCVTTAAALARDLSLEVVDNRGAAVHLYRRAGWLETGRTPIDWGGEHASELIRFTAP
ncbi:GNAT family N-acetyltransferase [Kribbella pratensis]|jgi:ribosomal-protein-alanine N-acetyltransferase|uniref:Ribosomal protein S18 acetylase RimI-like enzyme n=1 Tax=Kribbella pratensis TaxID=2512112 RepID=A0A4R8BVN1_9ACTN|nr:ribosomal protein S18 acetylase RimI-like enzyme [Kribbella pratensis]